jgi:hypothetical protein
VKAYERYQENLGGRQLSLLGEYDRRNGDSEPVESPGA